MSEGGAAASVERRLRYEPRLDGLRAIAVTMVIVSHCFRRLDGAGTTGVGVFFVLSGFLITAIIDEERSTTGGINFRFFYARRALRLYPALVVFVAVFVIGLFFHYWSAPIGRGLAASVMALTYTTDIFNLVGKGHWTAFELLLTWSLAVEEQFYLVWPITYTWLMNKFPTWRARWTILGIGIAIGAVTRVVLSTQAGIALTPFEWADGLLIGCALGLAYRHGFVTPRRVHPLLLVLAALPAARIVAWRVHSGLDELELTVFFAGVAVWIVHALYHAPRYDLLGSKVMARIGRLSYGMYLWHSLALAAFKHVWDDNTLGYFLAVYAVTFVAAELSYRFVEAPFLRRKQRFSVSAAPVV